MEIKDPTTYMHTFQFPSLTTEAFLDFLKAELSDVFENVEINTWIYRPGMPEVETWHRPKSRLFDEVQQVLNDHKQGLRPTQEQVQNWHYYQTLSFLQGLPKQIPSMTSPNPKM